LDTAVFKRQLGDKTKDQDMKINRKNKQLIIFFCIILFIWVVKDPLLKRFGGNNVQIKVLTPDKIIDAPKFSLPDINGRKVRLDDFEKSYILLNFWANW
jgi:hypothetical protein